MISDAHKGLVSAIRQSFINASWQRCQVHFLRNILTSILKKNSKPFREAVNSEKHVKLYLYLKKHKAANNEIIKTLLQFSRSSVTSNFLAKLRYTKNTGKSRSSLWSLK